MNKKPTLKELQKIMKQQGGYLDLYGTKITALPDNLTVGDNLFLNGTSITALPDNLTVGGSLYLRGTNITALPDNLTVGGSLYLRGTSITNREHYQSLKEGDCVPGKYIYCDGILTHIKRKRQFGKYTYYVGKIKRKNVIYDGTHYAHCESFRDGIADLEFKSAKDRGAEQYRSYTLDTSLTPEEAKTMYRIITGACRPGTQSFVDGLGKLKDRYTVREIITLTEGHYGAETFRKFFEG